MEQCKLSCFRHVYACKSVTDLPRSQTWLKLHSPYLVCVTMGFESAASGAMRRLRNVAASRLSCSLSTKGGGRFFSSSTLGGEPPASPEVVVAEAVEVKPPDRTKLLVLGGNGFVGTHVCKEALQRGVSVLSLNRSGRPQVKEAWADKVTWIRGNLLDSNPWDDILKEVSSVISCVGGFGSNEAMRKINGDANVKAVNEAAKAGVKRFVYVSAANFGLPSFFLRGYYEGKKSAEDAVRAKFPYGGVILRPGFIYGTRQVGSFQIPLGVIGSPLEMVFRNLKSASQVPVIGQLLTPPVKVTAVAKTAVRAALDNAIPPGILDVWGIIRLGDR